MVGQLHLLLYLFYQAELLHDYKILRPASFGVLLTYNFDHVTCHVNILLKFAKSAN